MPDAAAGDAVTASMFAKTEWEQDDTPITSIAETGYTVGTPECGTTFFTNEFGKVMVTVGGVARGGAADRPDLAPQIFEGADASGTQVLAPSVLSHGWSPAEGTLFAMGSRTTPVLALAPNTQHFARVVYKSANGNSTAEISRREIVVAPTS